MWSIRLHEPAIQHRVPVRRETLSAPGRQPSHKALTTSSVSAARAYRVSGLGSGSAEKFSLADRRRDEVPRGPAVADVIQGAEHAREIERVMEGRGNRRDQPDRPGDLAERSHIKQRLLRADGSLSAEAQQVGHEQQVEARRLGEPGDPDRRVQGGAVRIEGELIDAGRSTGTPVTIRGVLGRSAGMGGSW